MSIKEGRARGGKKIHYRHLNIFSGPRPNLLLRWLYPRCQEVAAKTDMSWPMGGRHSPSQIFAANSWPLGIRRDKNAGMSWTVVGLGVGVG